MACQDQGDDEDGTDDEESAEHDCALVERLRHPVYIYVALLLYHRVMLLLCHPVYIPAYRLCCTQGGVSRPG